MFRMVLGLGVAAACGLAGAADIFVDDGERRRVDVEADLVEADRLFVAADGTVDKLGAGTWAVPAASQTLMAGTFAVHDGTLDLQAGTRPAAPEPRAVLNRAAFWFDASAAGTVLTTTSNDTQWVDAWLDVRETGTAETGYAYPRATPNFVPTNIPPRLVTKEGVQAVYFGGRGSGISMDWRKPDGALLRMTNIRHVFLLHGVWDCYGFVLGIRDSDYGEGSGSRFHIGDVYCSPGSTIYRYSYPDNLAPYTGRVYQNGRRVDGGRTAPLQRQFQLQEVDCSGDVGWASCFFNDRNYFARNEKFPQIGGDRIGGDYLAAAIVFTNALTTAERLQVETWMMDRWLGGKGTSGGAVLVAEGARASVPVAGNVGPLLSRAGGDGVLELKADGMTEELTCSPNASYGTALDLAIGTLPTGPSLPLALSAGRRYTMETPARLLPCLSVAADAEAGGAVKDGAGEIRVVRLADDATNLVVQAGTLALAQPGAPNGALRKEGTAAASIPAGTCENWTDTSQQILNDQVYAGWHLVGLRGQADNYRDVVIFTSGNGTGGGWASVGEPFNAPLPAPDGSRIMMIKGDSSVWTEVTLPVDGEYELAFETSARGNYANLWVDLCIGPDADHLLPFATYASIEGWATRTFRTPWLRAGTYQLWFRNKQQHKDRTMAVDNVRMTLLPGDTAARMSIPNGRFEATVADFNTGYWNASDNAVGWHFVPDAPWTDTTQIPPVFLVAPQMGQQYFDASFNAYGSRQLAVTASGSQVENTFRVSESGTWTLKMLASARQRVNYCAASIRVAGALVRGEETLDLGALDVTEPHLHAYAFPKAVDLVAGEDVTLRLTVTWTKNDSSRYAYLLMDDFEFASTATSDEGPDILTDGGFEQADTWQIASFPKASPTGINGSRRRPYSELAQFYGWATYAGSHMMCVVQNDITWQTLDVPEAGLYRLRFHTHSRMDDVWGKGGNPVNAFWMDPDEPARTNWIGRSRAVSTNFMEAVFLTRLPKKDGLVFGFQGGASHVQGAAELKANDLTAILDGASLRRVLGPEDALPDVPENLTVRVAQGAKLRLDFGGTLSLAGLRLGFRAVAGTVSAATHPDFISGPGTLEVKPRGFYLYIR